MLVKQLSITVYPAQNIENMYNDAINCTRMFLLVKECKLVE
jgi:hypothetical protein